MIGTNYRNVTIWSNFVRRKFTWDDDDNDQIERFVLENLGVKWRERRGRIWKKAGWDASQGLDFNLPGRPEGINERDWDMFCRYRTSKEYLDASARNAKNRAKQDIYHTKGSR
ncbi:hypothetical protein LINPERHAP1_LOCUS36634, partial [Linum perenne]